MLSYVASYLILFLPVIASVFCFLINFKKTDFWIFAGTILAMLLLVAKINLDFTISKPVIKNDAELGIFSIPTEYYLDFLALFFISLTLLTRFLLAFFYQQDISMALKKDGRQLFYTASLLNLFGVVGIFATNNIFNLFIFIEIYCLTFCAIMTMSNDLSISKLAFQYFCRSALASIILLLALVLLYVFSGELKIDVIANLTNIYNIDLIFWLVAIALLLKFFPVSIYLKSLKSKDSLVNFLISIAFITKTLVGFYLLLRMSLFLFHPDAAFFYLLATTGFFLVFYSSYKMLGTKHLRVVAVYLALINLGLALITIGLFIKQALLIGLIYVACCVVVSTLFLLMAGIMYKKFSSSHFRHLSKINQPNIGEKPKNKEFVSKYVEKDRFCDGLLMGLIMFIVLNPPITLMFWSSWHLSLLALNSNIGMMAIVAIIIANLATTILAIRVISSTICNAPITIGLTQSEYRKEIL